jgi:plastocyanin
MRRSAALILLAIVATGPAVRAQEERPSGSSVSALDNVFTPEMIRIAPGETVGWTIDGRSPHTVDADDGSWSSGNLDPGATFEQRFDEPGVYRYFCRYHGRRGGVGMAGTIVVGDAPLPGGASPGREPVPAGPADTVRVPGDAPTIQTAVDRARPGGLVLIAPGVYREAVVVTTPYLTIRGIDGTETVLDGGSRLANGIHVIEADGVSIENLTARRYLLNGFSWSGVYGYRGTHLTAHANGEHGVFAFESRFGRIEHSYASGSPDAGFSIAACYPCDAVITDVLAEHNALGYSGTNAGGNLAIVNSEWRDNLAGIVPNTLDSEPFAPQRGAVIAGNHVHHNNSTTIGAATDFGSIPFGIGIAVAGGRDDRIVGNLVEDQATYGIGIGPLLDVNLWPSSGNRVEGNIVRRSGRADLALAAPAGGGDCFERNEAWSSQPAAVDVLFPCEGIRPFPLGGGSLAPTINAFSRYLDPPGGSSPRGDWRDQPPPAAALPSMPGDPGAAPPDPAIPDDVVPGPYRIRPVSEIRSAGGPAVGKEVSLMGVPLATSWWSLLLGLYGYILPFVLYASWVAVAMWDLIRRETEPTSTRIGWIAVVLLIPFVGPLLYYAMGRSPIPASMRLALTAGGALAYLVFVGLGVVLGG